MGASIDDVIATAATHLLMVQRHSPEQVADYLVRMADRTSATEDRERRRMWDAPERWAGAHPVENESFATQ